MKRVFISTSLVLFFGIFFFSACQNNRNDSNGLVITYPFENTVFPADITAPTFVWNDKLEENIIWEIEVSVNGEKIFEDETSERKWQADKVEWENIKAKSDRTQTIFTVVGKNGKLKASVSILISEDKVEAPVFFRSVPLPFKFARENLKRVRWHLGSIAEESKPHIVLDNIPVCANCHSFTPQGNTIAMDVDARDDKGAYAISSLQPETFFAEDSIIHWSDFQEGKFTYGLLSQISPDGRYVVSTLNDCEIFADKKDLEYSQLFFPFKGILVVYDRVEQRYFELEGANDTVFVQSNPCWSPDGKSIFFTKAPAKHFNESGIHNGSVPKPEAAKRYQMFEKHYMQRDSLIKFNIYKLDFNNGNGGRSVPVKGASNNGKSNYFPKISPDGKWLVFCQAESFMLLQKDSKLNIVPAEGGEARELKCNTGNMNSWHSWSPNSKWLVFSTKAMGPYTQLFLTHIDENGNDSPPVFLEKFSFDNYAVNIPEFVNIKYDKDIKINPAFLSENDFIIRNGEIELKNGNLTKAFNHFDKAVKMFPTNSEPYYQRGRIFFEKNNLVKAIHDFNKAIEIEERSTYYTSRGIAYLKVNKNEKAIDDLKMAARLDPESYKPFTYLGIANYNAGDMEGAVSNLQKAVALFDGDAYTFYYLGLVNYSVSSWEKAKQALSKAIELNPEKSIKPLVYELKARILFKQGNYIGTINNVTMASKLLPNDASLYLLKGKAELKQGLNYEAKNSFNRAISLGSQEAAVYLRRNF